MATRTNVVLAGALAVLAGVAQAAPDDRFYFSLGGTYIVQDDARFSDPGVGVNLGLGRRFSPRWGGELRGFSSSFGTDVPAGKIADWSEYGAGLDVHYFLTRGYGFAPYLLAGGGMIRSSEDAVTNLRSNDAFGNVGIGSTLAFNLGSYRLALRGDYRYRFFEIDEPGIGGLNEHLISLGLVLPFGSGAKPADAEKPFVDSDGDGVPDHLDQCPNTPAGVRVDARGCPLDSDGDGVPDYLDKCPDTKPGVKVDQHGCPVDAVGPARVFENVYFAFDRSDLSAQAQAVLDSAANVINKLLTEHPRLVVQLDGHTDSIGSPGYNQALSERRAASVKQYLVRKGVDSRRIQTQAFGLTKPVASNDTEEGRALNRRVEIRTREN